MNSMIYTGQVMHARLAPVRHEFKYPLFMMALDLDELADLDKSTRLFGYNRLAPFSIYDKDYLDKGEGSIRERIKIFLDQRAPHLDIKRVMLVTMARMFNYSFNPVSFYYCYDSSGKLAGVLAEVNNTFGERHFYLLDKLDTDEENDQPARAEHEKEFHVSPFFDRQGDYEFYFYDLNDSMDIRVNLLRDGQRVLVTRLWGDAIAPTTSNLAKVLFSYPLNTIKTVPLIAWEAAKLYYKKRLPVYSKPNPSSESTLRVSRPKWRHILARKIVYRVFSKIEFGRLDIVQTDRTIRTFGKGSDVEAVRLVVHNDRFFQRLLLGGDIGLGDSYMDKDWTTDDLSALLKLMIDNSEILDRVEYKWSWVERFWNHIRHLLRRNTIKGARQNISKHYDLSNEMYRLFLDKTMNYSSGIYISDNETLEEAQHNKMQAIIDKLQLRPEHHLLEIGTGWGGLAIEAAKKSGCRVTTITLSEEQQSLAQNRIHEAGLGDRVDVQLCDFRNMVGKFDRIVSVEMIEAVGHEYFSIFFRAIDSLLKPDGIVVIQAITIPDSRYNTYRNGCDWIRKHIFPGGHLPSIGALSVAMKKSSRLTLKSLEEIGLSYARTLREWRNNFNAQRDAVKQLGFDECFMRMWEFYLSYCEAGFDRRIINDHQIVLTKDDKTSTV